MFQLYRCQPGANRFIDLNTKVRAYHKHSHALDTATAEVDNSQPDLPLRFGTYRRAQLRTRRDTRKMEDKYLNEINKTFKESFKRFGKPPYSSIPPEDETIDITRRPMTSRSINLTRPTVDHPHYSSSTNIRSSSYTKLCEEFMPMKTKPRYNICTQYPIQPPPPKAQTARAHVPRRNNRPKQKKITREIIKIDQTIEVKEEEVVEEEIPQISDDIDKQMINASNEIFPMEEDFEQHLECEAGPEIPLVSFGI